MRYYNVKTGFANFFLPLRIPYGEIMALWHDTFGQFLPKRTETPLKRIQEENVGHTTDPTPKRKSVGAKQKADAIISDDTSPKIWKDGESPSVCEILNRGD